MGVQKVCRPTMKEHRYKGHEPFEHPLYDLCIAAFAMIFQNPKLLLIIVVARVVARAFLVPGGHLAKRSEHIDF